MPPASRHIVVALLALAVVPAAACGAKSGLELGPARDGGRRVPPWLMDGGPGDARPESSCPAPCGDGVFCNGDEICDETTARCAPGPERDCSDGTECTVDSCDRALDTCVHTVMDRDFDGDGHWSCRDDCNDSDATIHPGAVEVCDGVDQDCDGSIDEGVTFECGDCRPGCHRVVIPTQTSPTMRWEPDTSTSAGVEVDSSGALVLSSERTETFFAWIANHLFATITKLDTRDGHQAAEFDSVLLDGRNHAAPPGQQCEWLRRGGNCPSRTAVDLRGAVYIANRAFFGQGTVTKIAGFPEDCVDRNGNGVIDTSGDRDGDGRIERTVPGEFLGQSDECLLWTVDAGPIDGVPRAIAVAADGTVWVGLWGSRQVLQLDPSDGHVLRSIPLDRALFQPYGGAIDSHGLLWLVEVGTGRIMSVDTTTGVPSTPVLARAGDGCSGSYGIAVDAHDRVWIAGFQCHYAYRFDPSTRRWLHVSLPDSGVGRGIAVDDRGTVYMASSHEWVRLGSGIGGIEAGESISRLTTFRADDGGGIRIFGRPSAPLPGLASIGVGLDSARMVWLVNQESGSATRIDPATGAAREFEVGESPYTYSDFTGFALRTFTAPNGFIRTVLEGCGMGPTEWERVWWDAELPAGGRVEIRARAAGTRTALGTTSWVGPWREQPVDLMMSPGPLTTDRFAEFETGLVSADTVHSPAVRTVTVQYNCPI